MFRRFYADPDTFEHRRIFQNRVLWCSCDSFLIMTLHDSSGHIRVVFFPKKLLTGFGAEEYTVRLLEDITGDIFVKRGIDAMRVTQIINPVLDNFPCEHDIADRICYKVTDRSHATWNITEEEFQDFCEYFANYGQYKEWQKDKIYNRSILLYLLVFLRITGLRPQEAKALKRKDFSKDEITFRDQKTGNLITTKRIIVKVNKSVGSTRTEELTIKDTKTGPSVRAVPILAKGDRDIVNELLAFSKHDFIFADYYGQFFSSKDVADYIGRVKRSYNKAKGKELDIYAYLMRKTLGSDTEKSGTLAARKKIMGHQSEYTAGRWYSSADEDDVLSSVWNREYLHEKK